MSDEVTMSEALAVNGIDLTDALDDFGKVQASGAGRYVEPGRYIFKISTVEIKKGHKGLTAIGTNEVAHIYQSEDTELKIGDERNLVEPLSGTNATVGKSNLKGYLLAACESLFQQKIDQKKVDANFVIPLIGPTQPLKGVYVICEAFKKEKKNKPGEYITAKNWRMVTNEELAGYGLRQPPRPGT